MLLVLRNFPPIIGGMERMLLHVYRELAVEFDLGLVGPAGCRGQVRQETPVVECPLAPLPRFLAHCQVGAFRLARKFRPDLVLSGTGLTAPAALAAGRAAGSATACLVYGLDLVASHPLYQMLFVPAIRRIDAIVAISRNTARLAESAGVAPERISILHPGVSVPFASARTTHSVFRERWDIGDRPVLLSVGRLTRRKGLVEFIHRVMPDLLATSPDLVFAILGGEPALGLAKSSGEVRRIRRAVAERRLENHVIVAGAVDDEMVRAAYLESDLLVFPVLDLPGDVEGFGMVAVEAAAHGLPSVAFASGGVPDAVEDGVSGMLLEPGDYSGFAEAILRFLHREDRAKWRPRCIEFAEAFSWENFGVRLRKIMGTVTFS